MSKYPFDVPPGRMPQGLVKLASAPPLDPQFSLWLAAVIAAGGSVSPAQQTAANAAFTSLTSSGWGARLDQLVLTGGNEIQNRVDWITRATHTPSGTMSWVANEGFTSDGTTGNIDTGLAPSAATHFTLNKAMYGVAISSLRAVAAVMCVMGTSSDNDGECRIYPDYTGNQSFTSINHQFSTSTPTPPVPIHGIYMENRPDSGHMVYYRGTTVLRNDAVAATSLDTNTFLISAVHTGGVAADFSTDTNAGWWIGDGAANDADQAVLEGIINTYLTAIGAFIPIDPAFTAWLAAVTTAGGSVSGSRQALYNALFANLRSAGFLTGVLDRLWIFAAQDVPTSLIDLIGLTTAGNINSMPFVVDRGYQSDGSATELLVSNYNPTTDAVHYTTNSAHQAWYLNVADTTQDTSAGNYDQGAGIDSHNFLAYNDGGFPVNGSFVVAINMHSTDGVAYGSGFTTGMFIGDRVGASEVLAVVNGTLVGTNTGPAVAPSNNQFYINAIDNNGNPILLSQSRWAMYSTGGSFGSAANDVAFTSIITSFLSSIGAN